MDVEIGEHDRIKVTALFNGKLYWYMTNNESDLASTADKFESEYNAKTSNKDYISLSKNDEYKLYYTDITKKYIVICYYAGGEFLKPVSINVSDRSSVNSGSSNSFDDGSTKNGTGLSSTTELDGNIVVISEHAGDIEFFYVVNGIKYPVSTKSVSAGESAEFTFISTGLLEYLGSGMTLYVQLTTSSGVYEAYPIVKFGN